MGWACPGCGACYSPSVAQCAACQPRTYTNGTGSAACAHDFDLSSTAPKCRKCGAWRTATPPIWIGTSLALLVVLGGASGCGASALRTHQTIATIARVSVVAAHPAIVSTCETLTSRCTDVACVERVTADCDAAGTARDVAHAAVRAYVDTIEIAARADEGQVAAALDLALQTVADAYDAARTTIARLTGYQLPELPPIAVTILRALAAQVVPGGAS